MSTPLLVYIPLSRDHHAVINAECVVAIYEVSSTYGEKTTRIQLQTQGGALFDLNTIASAEQILGLITFEREKQQRAAKP